MVVSYLRHIAKFFVPVIIFTVGCFVTNYNINQHYHKLSNGYIVKHAHPYQKDSSGLPFQSHNHSLFEFFLLDQFSVALFVFASVIFSVVLILFLISRVSFPVVIGYKQTDLYYLKNYHAPPFIVS